MAAGPRPGSGVVLRRSRRCRLFFRRVRQAQPGGVGGGDAPGRRIEFGQHRRDVMVDRLRRDEQLGGDLGVGVPGADQAKNVALRRDACVINGVRMAVARGCAPR